MTPDSLSVRELELNDIKSISDYWLLSDPGFMKGMGVDLAKIPTREELNAMLNEQVHQPYNEKKSYCMIWMVDGVAVGHSNVNKIIFGEEAFMHLHLWNSTHRKKGNGSAFVRMTLPYFFRNLELKTIYSEPYALNQAPNKTLEKAGFSFVKNYITIPGWINFEQEVNLWEMKKSDFIQKK